MARPILDDLELTQVQEVATLDHRVLPELKPPGMDGSVLQNLGRRPTRLVLWGVATGPEARTFIEKLDGKFRAAKPVPFATDIIADAKIDQMLIADVRFQELAGRPQRFSYIVTLNEFIKPVEPEDTSAVDTSILGDAAGLAKSLVGGAGAGAAFLSGLEPFVSRLGDLLTRLQAFAKAIPH